MNHTTRKVTMFFLAFGFQFFIYANAQDLATFEGRKQWLLKGLKDVELITNGSTEGKHNLPKAIARLYNNPKDKVALDYITNVLHHPKQNLFDFPGVALALGKYWDLFSPQQIAVIKKDLERLATEDKNEGEGFLGHGTENHATMMWTSAYLFGQYFPDAKWANGMTSQQLMAEMKERLRKTFKNVYAKGYTEYLSTTYEITMNFPVAILYEFVKDPEVKAISEAFLLYKWSLQSTNNFEGRTLAPYGRMNTQEDYNPTDAYITAALYQNWLYWGWGQNTKSVKIQDFINYWDATFAIYTALSGTTPDPVFFKLGNGEGVPYELKSSASSFGPFAGERARPHMMMRNIYRDKLFAIGTGNFRWYPGGDYADHDTNGFNIIWNSADRFNYINCFHPYWYSDGDEKDHTPDTWNKGSISPFQQTAHDRNTAVTLFNIPDKDPWQNKPNETKWAWRDGHAQNLIKRGMLRYPKSVDEMKEKKGWIFLREGKVFIGIKPLKPYYIQTDLTGPGLDGFNIVKSDEAKTGFIFEISTEEKGSFKKFQDKLTGKTVVVDWDNMILDYVSLDNHKIRIQYNAGLPVDPDGLARSVPSVWINGKAEMPYNEWPMLQSPAANLDKSLLTVNAGESTISVDWTGNNPRISRQKTTVGAASPATLEESHRRGGLPNFFGKIKAGQEIRVAYIGGSITETPDGWRDLTFSWLRSNYPLASFKQTDATIGGTGSDLGVFRMDKDVLSQKPDLVFVEFSVNDFGRPVESINKTIEGIVRKTWKSNPLADIVFVYTVTENLVKTMRSGSYQYTAAAMEKIAEHYQIPSIHMGVEVIRLLEEGKLVFTGKPGEHPGKIIFTMDSTHPLPLSGHPIYAHSVIGFLKQMEQNNSPKPHPLVQPLVADNWENAKMIPLSQLNPDSGWEALPADDELGRLFSKFMPVLYKANPPSASFTVRFTGSALGVYDVIGPKTGIIEIIVDGQKPRELNRFDQWCNNYRKNSFFIDSLTQGQHEVTFRVTGKPFDKAPILSKKGITMTNPADYDGYGWFVNSVLLVGDLTK